MDIFAFTHTPNPTKVRVVEREQNKDEPRVLHTTVGHTVPLLAVAPDRANSELEASVERLLDEDGSGTQIEQGDFARGGLDANIQSVVEAAKTDAAPGQARRQEKRKSMVVDAGGVSYPPKKLTEDHGTPSGASIGGKSQSALQRLLTGAVLNAEVEVAAIPTFPFMTASVSTTLEPEDGDHTDFVAEPNLSATTVTSTVDSALVAKEKLVKPSLFYVDSFLAGEADPNTGVFSDLIGSNFLSVTNRSYLNDGHVCREMVDEFAPPKFFASVCEMEHDQLFIEFNVRAARQMSLSAEVRMHAEYNVKEKRRLKFVVKNQGELLKAREEEIEGLKARLLLKEAEVVEATRLRAEASNFETMEKSLRDETNALRECNVILEKELNTLDVKVTKLETSVMSKEQKVTVYENCLEQLEKFQDDRMKIVNDKFDKMYTDFVELALHLEEKFYPHLLTTIFGRRWLLTQGMELAIIKCLNSPEYVSALKAAIGKAIEKGMQNRLSAGITYAKEGRVLTDVAAYIPSAEADYTSTLQQIQNMNFPLLAESRSNNDASIKAIMNILRWKGPCRQPWDSIDGLIERLKKALDDKLGYPLMIISRDEHLIHSVPRELSGGGVIDLTNDEDPTDEDGDTGMDDSTVVSTSLGGEISSGGRKSWKSNHDNTGGITVGEAIKACSRGIEFFKKSEEMFPGVAGK
nr:hypothetical protein [Tanacetum cinerariifolium]